MASLMPENIRKLLNQHTFDVDADSITEDVSCVICCKLMLDAYLTDCGCKYCRECLTKYLKDGNSHCRGGKEECKEERLVLDDNVNRSSMLDKKTLRVIVRCPNKSCEFTSKLADMEEHLRVCSQLPIECPYTTIGCGIEGCSRDMVESHLHRETLEHSVLMMEVINNLRNEVGGLKDDIQSTKLAMNATTRLDEEKEMLERLADERKLREEHIGRIDGEKIEIAEMRNKMEDIEEDSEKRRMEMEAVTNELKRVSDNNVVLDEKSVEIGNTVMESQTKMAVIEEEMRRLWREMETEKAESRKMRGEVETLEEEVKRVNASNVRLEAENADMRTKMIEGAESAAATVMEDRRRVDELARTLDRANMGKDREGAVGELWFTVDRVAERMKTGEYADSPHLYSHANGYKLRIRVDPGRQGPKWFSWYRSVSLDVSSSVCRGEFDAVLSWPCRFALSVAAVHRDSRLPYETRIIKYVSDTDTQYSNKPSGTDNPQYGGVSLASHSDIRSSGAIVDDSLLFHVVVAL